MIREKALASRPNCRRDDDVRFIILIIIRILQSARVRSISRFFAASQQSYTNENDIVIPRVYKRPKRKIRKKEDKA